MPNGYTVIVNVFNGSFTGHVNVTLVGPDGYFYTFGNNITDGSWGVQREFNENRTDMFSTHYPVSYDQMMQMYNWVTNILDDPGNSYGLLGRNCVDFVRDMFSAGGLGTQISHLMQWMDSPVNHYAAITDWLKANGFGEMWAGIGTTLGVLGEVGSFLINTAGDVWSDAGDIVGAAYDFISRISDSIGGFIGSLGSDIWDFFRSFGRDRVGDGDVEEPPPLGLSGDEFILNGEETYSSMSLTDDFDQIEIAPKAATTTYFASPANDDTFAAFALREIDSSDYLLG